MARGATIVSEGVKFYLDAGTEVATTPAEWEQLGAAWQATQTEPLAVVLLERAKDNGNSNPGAIDLTILGLRLAGNTLIVTAVLPEGTVPFTLQSPLAPPTIPAARITAIRSALIEANGSRLTLAERDGIVFTIRRVEGEGYRLVGSVKYNINEGIDLEFSGVRSNSGRIALAEAKAGSGLNMLDVDANGVRQGSLEFFRSRAMRAGRLDLVDALDAGDVDAFGGFSESGRLFKFNLDIFVDDVNFRTTPGAATLVPP